MSRFCINFQSFICFEILNCFLNSEDDAVWWLSSQVNAKIARLTQNVLTGNVMKLETDTVFYWIVLSVITWERVPSTPLVTYNMVSWGLHWSLLSWFYAVHVYKCNNSHLQCLQCYWHAEVQEKCLQSATLRVVLPVSCNRRFWCSAADRRTCGSWICFTHRTVSASAASSCRKLNAFLGVQYFIVILLMSLCCNFRRRQQLIWHSSQKKSWAVVTQVC